MIPIIKHEAQAIGIIKDIVWKEAQQILRTENVIYDFQEVNFNRYAILKFIHEHRKVKYAVLFKTQKFHSFGKIYNMGNIEGETINESDYKNYFEDCDKIFFVYQNTHSLEIRYTTPLQIRRMEIKGQLHHHINKNDNGVRQLAFPYLEMNLLQITNEVE